MNGTDVESTATTLTLDLEPKRFPQNIYLPYTHAVNKILDYSTL